MLGANASMAMKWVAQMPNPLAVAATPSQSCRIWRGRAADMMGEIDRCERGQCAHDCRKHDQAQIVFLNDAGINSEHGATV